MTFACFPEMTELGVVVTVTTSVDNGDMMICVVPLPVVYSALEAVAVTSTIVWSLTLGAV